MNETKVHPAAEIFPLLCDAELEDLAADIRAHGQRLPAIVHDGQILDGRNRQAACKRAGVPLRTERYAGPTDDEALFAYVLSTNLQRRHLNETQRAMVASRLSEGLAGAAAKRMADAGARGSEGGRGNKKPSGQIRPKGSDDGKTAVRAAKQLKVGASSVKAANTVRKRGVPELVAMCDAGRVAVSVAAKVAAKGEEEQRRLISLAPKPSDLKRAAKLVIAEQIKAEPPPMPEGPFRVLVLDPPWRYEKRAEDPTHRAVCPYPDMSIEEICALPVAARAHDDCVLWLWTTNAFMRDAYRCLDAWGFQEKTILTWAKDRMGTGDWLRGRTEHCILAVRGKPTVVLTNQTTLLEAPLREHSRKPDEFYALVEALCPGSKVEFFSRQPREGWACTGAETEKFGG